MRTELTPQQRQQLLVWWIIWGAILAGLIIIYFVFARRPPPPAAPKDVLLNLAGLAPIFVSIIIRWLVLPRIANFQRAFVTSIVGIALAEGCGILGIFLGGPYRDSLFLLGVLGITQYVPLFAKRLLTHPKAEGFVPNN